MQLEQKYELLEAIGDLSGDRRPDIVAKPYNWEAPRVDLWMNEG